MESVIKELKKFKDPAKARLLQGFFKTAPGEYGEGDIFWGLSVPQIRTIVKRYYSEASFKDIEVLLKSPVHEHRFAGLQILVFKYKKGNDAERKMVADFYFKHRRCANNWDLVDTSALYILGEHLIDKNRDVLYRLAVSKNLWDRRIAVLSTFAFIRRNDFKDALKISEMLLDDKHDLMHKAVGWMLREVGKKSLKTETAFLDKHYRKMPRTMLRYAIERLPEPLRIRYMAK